MDNLVLDDQQVDLLLVLVAIEEELRLLATVPPRLEDLDQDPGFEDRPRRRAGLQRLGTGPTGQPGAKARVQEIEFGRLDQALGVQNCRPKFSATA